MDFPATQNKKNKKLQKIGLPKPENLHFIPIDFESEKISDALANSNFDSQQPTFVTWQGVTYYLSMNAIENALSDLRDVCKSDLHVVLDYVHDGYFKVWNKSLQTRLLHIGVSLLGEPFKTGFNPSSFADWLNAQGYQLLEDLNTKHQFEYFSPATLNLYQPSRGIHLAHLCRVL